MSDKRLPDDEARRRDAEFGSSEVSDSEVGASDQGHPADTSDEPSDQTAGTEPESPTENPWAALKPWQGKATGLDRLLLFIIIGIPLVYLALMPLRPWMLVHAPVLQEFINGAKTAVVAAGAFARVGEIPLWLVVVAGFIGMAKFDWAFWLAGRRWGDGVLRLFAQNERQLKRIESLKRIPNWALFLMTVVSRCPGVPGTLVYLVAGWTRMRLSLFLVADLLGCLLFTIIWTTLGYQLGETAVDVLKVVDKYAMWLTLAIIVGIFVITYVREYRKQKNAQ
ncbi:membrane protein DedA, SNARE-associated domain [Brevibacterium sp. 239c]|uniref:DedA family protein n=1 Tax=Brevibacterium sp. 239c TaxID=1965356 RepID=UPI000C6C204E|nr:DedA family protein [Brevibacterium sp. 239c]SMX97141.1 membrane protein DedA, SNARE-associated domain [Brevibacterium sp. 239c]